jgi:Na+/H+-dicarboxylate symporter
MFNLPMRLVIAVALAFGLSSSVNSTAVVYFYSVSVVLKDLLMVLLPFVVFSYLSSAILSLQKQALTLILGVFGLVIAANMVNVFAAYGAAQTMLGFIKPICLDGSCANSGIEALWRIPLPKFFVSDKAMLLGLFVGVLGSFVKSSVVNSVVNSIKIWSTKALNVTFIPFLPVYVFGFVLKIGFEGELCTLVTAYAPVFFLCFFTIQAYLLFWFFVGCNCNFKTTLAAIRNMFPAWLTGFSTMSSAATLPITLRCVEKNIPNKNLVNFVVPATANIHMVGDGINITLTSIALLAMSGLPMPSFTAFLSYVGAYVLTKFSGSGVPGGGMIILLPVVEKHLGLSAELSSLVATLYILQDSLMTASNVAGNGALSLIANKIFAKKFVEEDLQPAS